MIDRFKNEAVEKYKFPQINYYDEELNEESDSNCNSKIVNKDDQNYQSNTTKPRMKTKYNLNWNRFLLINDPGFINDTFIITKRIQFLSVIIPSQITDCKNEKDYDEEIYIKLMKVTPNGSTVEAEGSFSGKIEYFKDMAVRLYKKNDPLQKPPVILPLKFPEEYYVIHITFLKSGLYPWLNIRNFSKTKVFSLPENSPGLIFGFEYIIL